MDSRFCYIILFFVLMCTFGLKSASQGQDKLLLKAAEQGDLPALKDQLDNGANINAQDEAGYTVLNIAATFGDELILRFLIGAGANIDIPNRQNYTPLCQAAIHGHEAVLRALIEADASIDALCSPLHWAAAYGRKEVVLILIAAGANIEGQDFCRKHTPLHWATMHGHETVVHALIVAGANIEAQNRDGNTPLAVALLNNMRIGIPTIRQILFYASLSDANRTALITRAQKSQEIRALIEEYNQRLAIAQERLLEIQNGALRDPMHIIFAMVGQDRIELA